MTLDCVPSLFSWGEPSLVWIAKYRQPWLTEAMHFFSSLGKTGPVLFILAIGYWIWNKRFIKYIGYGIFSALLLNLLLKGWIQECRPSSELWLEEVGNSFSFPSGHAQVTIVLWLGLAFYLQNRWLSLLCICIGIMIALSRPYLGVHYPQDIAAGVLIGMAVLWICILCERKKYQPLKALPLSFQAFMMVGLFLNYQLLLNDPVGTSVAGIGGFFGFWLGTQLESAKLNFVHPQDHFSKIKMLLVGIIGLLVFWKGGDLARSYLSAPLSINLKYVQYGFLGMWITYFAPKFYLYLTAISVREASIAEL